MVEIYDIKVKTLEGRSTDLAEYRGRVLLIVNVASRCGFTHQYRSLKALHAKYQLRGFCVLGFPCNDFLNQEPGSLAEIRDFCESDYGVQFDLFEKIRIRGSDAHPLYQALESSTLTVVSQGGIKSKLFRVFRFLMFLRSEGRAPKDGDVEWNFHKFLIDRKGNPVVHFASDCDPLDPNVIGCVERELRKKS
jgi:glutathione peroxidase|tara:strand:+ start:222 stop:797 length:576 start_codon:yes stop_codon:yes gene_type:complete